MCGLAVSKIVEQAGTGDRKMKVTRVLMLAIPFYLSVCMMIVDVFLGFTGLFYCGVAVYAFFAYFLAYCRSLARQSLVNNEKEGNILVDMMLSFFLYPCVAVQLQITSNKLPIK